MQLCISSTSQNWMLCNPDDKLQSNSYTITIFWKKNRARSVQDVVLLSTVSSWCQSTEKLSKGDWCPVRQNMANRSAPIAVNLCVPTASALQDYCFVLTASPIIELRLIQHNLYTHNLVFHHFDNSEDLNPLK